MPDSLDAARKLAELLARPLEPVARPPEPPGEPGATPLTVRRDAEYRLAEAATRPAQSAPPEPAPPEPAPPELAPPQPTPSAEPPAADLAAPPLPAEGTEAPAVPPAARSVILARFADAMARLVDEAKVPGGRPETLDGGGNPNRIRPLRPTMQATTSRHSSDLRKHQSQPKRCRARRCRPPSLPSRPSANPSGRPRSTGRPRTRRRNASSAGSAA